MSLTNPKTVVTEERLSEFYQQILPYLGGMPEMLANKFSKSDIYSTDEKMIGQWIDGKPLYQKTIDCGAVPSGVLNGQKIYSWLNSNVENVFVKHLFVKTDNGAIQNIPYVNPTNNAMYEIGASILLDPNNSELKVLLYTGTDRSSSGHIWSTVCYTKTTDSPAAIGSDTDYSTEEKIIGTWIDGKPLYQKTLVINANEWAVNNKKKYILLSNKISNVEDVIDAYGFVCINYNSSILKYQFGTTDTGSTGDISILSNYSQGKICVTDLISGSMADGTKITFVYTKTTD